MGETPILVEQIKAARIYLGLTQAELSSELKGAGITTINRWENGHSTPTGAWRVLLEDFFVQRIGRNWRSISTRSKRYRVEQRLREMAGEQGINLRISPSDTVEMLERQIKDLQPSE